MPPLHEMTETKVTRGGVEIAYWLLGEGAPIVLITGLATPAATWMVLPDLLASSGYQVLAVDNRDCGKSSPCDGINYTIKDMADDVVAVMDAVGFERAYVFGISMGGMIAQELAINYPGRVEKLILCATSPGGVQAVVPPAEQLTQMLTPPPMSDATEGMAQLLGRLMGPDFFQRHREAVMRMTQLRLQYGSDAGQFARQWQAILGHSTWDRLPQIKAPTLVIHGAADPLVPFENGKNIASRIPDASLKAIAGVGHFIPLESPLHIINAISEFFPSIATKSPEPV